MDKNEIKQIFLKAAFREIPFYNWSKKGLHAIDIEAGYTPGTHELFFPSGAIGMIDYFHSNLDEKMLVISIDCVAKGVRDRLFKALCFRFEEYEKIRAFTIRCNCYLSMPHNFIHAKKIAWRTVDSMWRHFGMDMSTDFNYYTKRILLLAVYEASFLFWLSDESTNISDTKDFMRRRLDDTVSIGKRLSSIFKG